MRFCRTARYDPVDMTERKALQYLRKIERERARYPLLADQMNFPSLEDEAARRVRSQHESENRMRALTAKHWRQGRAAFFDATEPVKIAIRAMWAGWAGPRTATYFIYCVETCNGVAAARHAAFRAKTLAIRQDVRARMGEQLQLAA